MKIKFLIICLLIFICSVAVVSASDDADEAVSDFNESLKTVPVISINTTNIYTGDSIDIVFKDENETPISNLNFTANIDKKDYSLSTDSQGKSSLKLNLMANKYALKVSFLGNDNYSPLNQTFNINILKLDSNLNPVNTTVVKGNYLYVYLKDQNDEAITGVKVSFTVDGKTYTSTTNNNGSAGL